MVYRGFARRRFIAGLVICFVAESRAVPRLVWPELCQNCARRIFVTGVEPTPLNIREGSIYLDDMGRYCSGICNSRKPS